MTGRRGPIFEVHGAGTPALILLHGWACHRGFWDRSVTALSRERRVVALDLAGHGASAPLPLDQRLSMAAMAEDVLAVADGLSLRQIVLVGHSMGGFVALEAAIRLGDRCTMLVGVDTFTDAAFAARRPEPEIAARRDTFEADFSGTMTAMVDRITLAGGPQVVDWIAREMSRADPLTALAALEAMLEWDIAERWPLLRCRAATINSAILSRGIETVPGLDGPRVHLMDRVGHFPMLEDPPGFVALMRDILRRHG